MAVSVYGTSGLSLTDRLYRHDQSTRGCLYFWGHGNTAKTGRNALYWNGVQFDIAAAGIPLFTADFTGDHWGNDASIATVASARTAMNAQLGPRTDKVLLAGISMGALLALNWARQNLASVAAVALVTPAVSLQDIHDNNRGGYAAEIEAAYDGLAAYTAALPTHNPVEYAAELEGVPIEVWRSTTDTICTQATVDAFAATTGAEVHSLGAVGHTAGALDGQDIANFLLEHA